MRWESTSFAVQSISGTLASASVCSSRRARIPSSSTRADRMSARNSALLTPSLAAAPAPGSGEGGLELREIAVDCPGLAHDPQDRAEEGVVDLATFGDRERRGLVAL